MRRNSGKDEGRDNLLDPTMKEHERARGKSGEAVVGRPSGRRPVEYSGRAAEHGHGLPRTKGRRQGQQPLTDPVKPATRSSARVRTSLPARAGQPSAVSASRMPSPLQTTRHKMSERPGPAAAIAASNRWRASMARARRSGPRRPPRRGRSALHPSASSRRRQLRPFPVAPQPLAGVELSRRDRPRENNHPSGDSAKLTVTDRAGRRAGRARRSSPLWPLPIGRSLH